MCIIVAKNAEARISDEIYSECWRVNNDGMGVAYIDPDKKELVVSKGFMNKSEALKKLKELEELELLIHFRRTSKGTTTPDNTHPFFFRVPNKEGEHDYSWAIVHNGTLSYPPNNGKSDTHAFVEEVLKHLLSRDPWFLDNSIGEWMLENVVGTRNKLVIWRFDNDSKELTKYFINKKEGPSNEKDGVWYSNYSWMPIVRGGRFRDSEDAENWEAGGYDYGRYYGSGQNYGGSNNGGGHSGGTAQSDPLGILNTKRTNLDGESCPDHLGWRWSESKKCFVNDETKAETHTLTYRDPMQNEYTFQGKSYNRIAEGLSREKIKKSAPVVLAGEPLPKSEPKPSDSKISVPRDKGVTEDETDPWDEGDPTGRDIHMCKMQHLGNREKRELRRMAQKYAEEQFGGDIKEMNISWEDMVTFLRTEYVSAYPKSTTLGLKFIDNALLKGSFTKLGYCNIYESQNPGERRVVIAGERPAPVDPAN